MFQSNHQYFSSGWSANQPTERADWKTGTYSDHLKTNGSNQGRNDSESACTEIIFVENTKSVKLGKSRKIGQQENLGNP